MMKAIVIDDEEKARENLTTILKEFCEGVDVIAAAGSVREALGEIEKNKPDLLFLDIEMRNETGFDLLEKIKDFEFDVIFVTAHSEYAIKAFRFSALDYLLKPINIEELQDAVARVLSKKEKSGRTDVENLQAIITDLKKGKFTQVGLPTMDGLLFVKITDIVRLESNNNYTNFYLKNGDKLLISKPIRYFEDFFVDYHFCRLHQSHMVNLEHVSKYHKGDGGYVIMSDGSMVLVSRNNRSEFMKKISLM